MSLVIVLVSISVLLLLAAFSIVIVKQYNVGIVVRFGEYVRVFDAGFHLIIPLIEHVIHKEIKKTPLEFVVDNVRTPDSSDMLFPVHLIYLTIDPIAEALNKNPDKQIEEMLSQIISDFTKDPANPPVNWDEALHFSRGDKYISRIVAVIEGTEFPKYDRDDECSDAPSHNHTDAEKNMIKKGAYKFEACMTVEEKKDKKRIKKIAADLISGKGNFPIPGTGRILIQLTVESPKPGEKLQKFIEERNEITQKIRKAEESLKLEEKERAFETYDEETQAQKVKITSDITGIPTDIVYYRKLQGQGKISGNEYNINIPGLNAVLEKILAFFK